MRFISGLIPALAIFALGHVPPRLAPQDQMDARLINTEPPGQIAHSAVALAPSLAERSVQPTNFAHVRFDELREMDSFTARVTALPHHIRRILSVRAEKEMVHPNAIARVATMTYDHAVGFRTVFQNPRDNMRAERLTADSDHAVSVGEFGTPPEPATRRRSHLREKPPTQFIRSIERALCRHATPRRLERTLI